MSSISESPTPTPTPTPAPCRVAVVVSGWPRVSETFALGELTALHRRGVLAAVFATKAGDHALVQPDVDALRPLVTTLRPGDALRQAEEVAKRLLDLEVDVAGVHGYFAHLPAEVAEAAAGHLGVPFGFSVHALDARKVPSTELSRRARRARVVVACNDEVAAELDDPPALVRLPHGVDVERFAPAASPSSLGRPVEVLAVGRFVDKKGFIHLLRAMALLGDGYRLTLVGDGPGHAALAGEIDRAGLGTRVVLAGRATHADLPDRYRQADVVVVPSVVDAAGDRDGLPNVVLEAMASGLAVVASDVAAIPTAVTHDRTGVLVPPGDPAAIAAAVAALAADPARRDRLGRAARQVAVERFALRRCSDRFVDTLVAAYGGAR